ncbi:hypothetical protein P4H94_27005 [Paenibacillus macerans]|nr:hypothetical protein [Paenibacillus macerans]MBS5913488.1 hypothetical protein [Paenibacillus macerans]MEC0140497.1 hypothetical protein [Paenibacillus macerans]
MEFFLDTLTSRNQEKNFEHFCKDLAQIEICPNLLPQTGPTGGGDSKVDSETYPVSDSTSFNWYSGVGRDAANERWAFAISAKREWRSKVKSDVEKIYKTDRGYKKVFFMTNQAVPDKKRAEVEDSLSKQFSIDVRILDRTWLLDKLFNNQRQEIAINTFNLPNDFVDEINLGPLDYRRKKRLQTIETAISSQISNQEFNLLLVENAIESAILSRELELPKSDTMGRFERASKIAKQYGNSIQVKECLYQWAWTLYWWYEDKENFQKVFLEFMGNVIGSNNFFDIERLTNLWMNLYTAYDGNLENETLKSCTATLSEEYARLISDTERINTSLEARANFVFVKLFLGQDPEKLFQELKIIIQESSHSLDFSFNTVTKMVTELSPLLLDSDTFNELFEVLISMSGSREQELASAKLLLERGKSLYDEKPYSSIQFIGRSLVRLYKSESKRLLISAMFFMASCFNRIGLQWAAYGYFINAYYLAVIDYMKFGNVSPYFLGSSESLRNLEIQFGRLANSLEWHRLYLLSKELLNSAGYNIKSELIEEGDRIYDGILGTFFLKLKQSDLSKISKLPNPLEVNGLGMASVALKYSLGHIDPDLLESFGNDDDAINDFMFKWLDQPANNQLPNRLIFGNEQSEQLQSKILGCTITINSDVIFPCLELSQSILSCIEAFMSTSIVDAVMCRYPDVNVTLKFVERESYHLTFSRNEIRGNLHYSINCSNYSKDTFVKSQQETKDFLFKFIADFITNVFIFKDYKKQLEKLIVTDDALNRSIEFTSSIFVFDDLFGQQRQTLDTWIDASTVDFPLIREQELFEELPEASNLVEDVKDEDYQVKYGLPNDHNIESVNHQNIRMGKIINISLWDQAKWRGVLFLNFPDPNTLPILAPLFSNIEYGSLIFQNWIEELGKNDNKNRIKVGIIKGIDKNNPFHYKVAFTEDMNQTLQGLENGYLILPARFCIMEPLNNINLMNFIERIKLANFNYYLAPAFINPKTSKPDINFDYIIKKNQIEIKDAWEVGEESWLSHVITPDENPIIPATVHDPPVIKLLDLKKKLGQ